MCEVTPRNTSNAEHLETVLKFLKRLCVLTGALFIASGGAGLAQTITADARKVAMGGASDATNVGSSMIESAGPYTVIPLPFELIHLIKNHDQFNPISDQFDPVRAIESGSSPLHYTTGRGSADSGHPEQRFFTDLVHGGLNQDLSTYRGFLVPGALSARGLASGRFGKTFKVSQQPNGAFQGFYIGAGPYVSFDTTLGVDPTLTGILGSATPKYVPSSTFHLVNTSAVQLAMSITFGYRARLALPGTTAPAVASPRDGVYVAFDYRHLKGFKYLQPDVTVRFETDARGLVSNSPATSPITIDSLEASAGKGRAVDVGVEVVRRRWEAGVDVSGIGNQIDWTNVTRKRLTRMSLVHDSGVVEQARQTLLTNVIVKLPVVTSANVGFNTDYWTVATNLEHGYNGNSLRGGVERRLGPLGLRGGARYSRKHVDPSVGFGVGGKVALDIALFGTHANLQDKREMAIAVSLRINRNRPLSLRPSVR